MPAWETWMMRIINAAALLLLTYLALNVDFSGRGSLWDKLKGGAPPASADSRPLFTAHPPAAVDAPQKEPDRILAFETAPSPAEPSLRKSAAPQKPSLPQAPARETPVPHLTSTLPPFKIYEGNQHTSANLSETTAPQPMPSQPQTRPGASAAAPSKSSPVAATPRYGASSRSEVMGKAAGPVYNLK